MELWFYNFETTSRNFILWISLILRYMFEMFEENRVIEMFEFLIDHATHNSTEKWNKWIYFKKSRNNLLRIALLGLQPKTQNLTVATNPTSSVLLNLLNASSLPH
jgi:hypothetical protein